MLLPSTCLRLLQQVTVQQGLSQFPAFLTPDICKAVSHIIRALPLDNKYTRLKQRIIEKYSPTKHQKISHLFQECSLGDKKPSDFFAEIQLLGQGHIPEETLLLIWYKHLPNELAVQLNEAITAANAQQAIAKADRLHDRLKGTSYA
uniref:Uncharacterized protein n=1 Tax=Trichogramma kaykai TaxID=54128 RepID=A0ABD2WAV3_9HYME